jgi:hypothetical protein
LIIFKEVTLNISHVNWIDWTFFFKMTQELAWSVHFWVSSAHFIDSFKIYVEKAEKFATGLFQKSIIDNTVKKTTKIAFYPFDKEFQELHFWLFSFGKAHILKPILTKYILSSSFFEQFWSNLISAQLQRHLKSPWASSIYLFVEN